MSGRKFLTAEDRRRISVEFNDQSRTKEAFKDECDINMIMRKYMKTGQLPDMIKENPRYGNFADALDYQESLNMVLFAQEQFLALPSQVRERFGNDPAQFLAFATDPRNGGEMIKMGLATPSKDQAPKVPDNPPKRSEAPPEGGASDKA